MDQFINEQEQQIMELVETKTFAELTEVERLLVLKYLTQEEFDLQHRLVNETKFLINDLDPKPLQLDQKNSGIFVLIPLYQAVIGVAASVIISFLLFQPEPLDISNNGNMKLAKTDTVYVEKQLYDTVVIDKFVDRVVTIKSKKNDFKNASASNKQDITIAEPIVPSLNKLDLQNKGLALMHDETYSLVQEINSDKKAHLLFE